MTSFPLNVKSGYTIWLGALARLDLISGEDKYLTCIIPPDVTIHRTPIIKATTVFMNQADKLLKPSYFNRVEENDELSMEQNRIKAEDVLDKMERHEIKVPDLVNHSDLPMKVDPLRQVVTTNACLGLPPSSINRSVHSRPSSG